MRCAGLRGPPAVRWSGGGRSSESQVSPAASRWAAVAPARTREPRAGMTPHPPRREVSLVLKAVPPWTEESSLAGTRSARRPRSVSPPPMDAPPGHRTTPARAQRGRSIPTPPIVACSLPRHRRACPRLRGPARSTAPEPMRAQVATSSTRPSPVVAAARAAGSARRRRCAPSESRCTSGCQPFRPHLGAARARRDRGPAAHAVCGG
jgi:hypothetical protein